MRRALLLVPIGLLLIAAQPLYYGLRGDAPALGWLRLWGLSIAQSGLGVVLIAAALRDAVPGRRVPRVPALLMLGILASLGITFVTWTRSGTLVPPGRIGLFWTICFTRPILIGLPVALVGLALAWRAYPTRPALVGALVGLGAGLMTDAGWRTFCHVSDPTHVLSAHLAAVVALSALGAIAGAIAARTRD
jgi:hypothetical protein